MPSCSPAYPYVHTHTHTLPALKSSTFSYCFTFLTLLKIGLFKAWLSPLRLSLLCSFLNLSSQEKVKRMGISNFHLSLVLPVGKESRALDVLRSLSISIAINYGILYCWNTGSVQQQHHATLSHIPSTFISSQIAHVGLEMAHFFN